jgi:hypothetical protein
MTTDPPMVFSDSLCLPSAEGRPRCGTILLRPRCLARTLRPEAERKPKKRRKYDDCSDAALVLGLCVTVLLHRGAKQPGQVAEGV